MLKDNLGTPLEESDIEKAFVATEDSPSAFIIALNAARASDSPWAEATSPPRMMADANANAVAVMKKHGVKKIVTMAAMGVGDSLPNMIFFMRYIINHSNMKFSYEDHRLVDEELKQSGLDYVIARPTRLTAGASAPIKHYGNQGKGLGGFQAISRQSVAVFLVDAAEKSDWDKSTPVIAN
jgi:hypothetical protein